MSAFGTMRGGETVQRVVLRAGDLEVALLTHGARLHDVRLGGVPLALGTDDLIHAAGGGILAHPQGPRAGVESLREAWEAARAGEAIEARAARSPALAAALGAYR